MAIFKHDSLDLYEMVTLYNKIPFLALTKVNTCYRSIIHCLWISTFRNAFL